MCVRRALQISCLLAVLLLPGPWSGTAFSFSGGAPPPVRSMSGEVFNYVERFYVEPERIQPREMLASGLQDLETHHPEFVFALGDHGDGVTVNVNGEERTFDLPSGESLSSYSDLLDEIVVFASARTPEEGDAVKMRFEALAGSLRVLDPHTRVMEPAKAVDWQIQTDGSFGGVGFVVSAADDTIVVREVLGDTPASRIGIVTGDRITAVDDTPTAGLSAAETVGIIRGDPGSEVALTVSREGWEKPRRLTARREVIRLSSVRHSLLEEGGARVLHIRLNRFQKDSNMQMHEALDAADREGAAGIILDLRSNPGGLLDQAVKIADLFLDDGTIVTTRDHTGVVNTRSADPFGLVRAQKPLVVLVDGSSASASEIVSAALQENRAVLVGERTYGKGSVQKTFPLSGGGVLNLTVAHYLTPGNVSIQSAGIVPDILLSPVEVGDNMSIAPQGHHGREEHLPHAFASSGERPDNGERPVVEFFRDGGDGGGHDGDSGSFAVRLAARLIAAAAGEPSRRGILDTAPTVLTEAAAEEREKIRKAFAGQGIDWAPSAGAGSPRGLHIVLPEGLVLEAGGEKTFAVWIENRGDESLSQVWGRFSSENRALDGVDFAVGALAPGEKRRVELSVDVPVDAADRWDEFTVDLFASGLEKEGAGQGLVRTESGLQPDLVYSYTIDDDNRENPTQGGNGILEEGERGILRLTVLNRGEGDAGKIKIQAGTADRNLIALESRIVRFATLPAGSSRQDTIGFLVRKEAGTASISLRFVSEERGLLVSDTLEVPVMEPYAAGEDRHPPRIDLKPFPGLTNADSLRLMISTEDNGAVKDLYVYSGMKKVSYLRNTGGQEFLPATVDVPLSDGVNRIVIFARDRDNVVGRKTIHVLRQGPA